MKVADKLMQDVFIADKTGTARVTLWVWEENVGQVRRRKKLYDIGECQSLG